MGNANSLTLHYEVVKLQLSFGGRDYTLGCRRKYIYIYIIGCSGERNLAF